MGVMNGFPVHEIFDFPVCFRMNTTSNADCMKNVYSEKSWRDRVRKLVFFQKHIFIKIMFWFNDVSFTSNCFHLRSIASQLVTHTKNAIEL